MTTNRIPIRERLVHLIEQVDDDFLRRAVRLLAEGIMDMEVSEQAGAARYERSEGRSDVRNGYRTRRWDTRAGSLELRVPKLRHQGYQPSFLEPRSRSERAMFGVVQEAYIQGVSTRRVEALVQAMGIASMDKSRVSRMCEELDELVGQWRGRCLADHEHPYVWVDAKYLNVRAGGRVSKEALVVAYAVTEAGYRTILGVDLFELESAETWQTFLRSLLERGLKGVRLVISDDHLGLKAAIPKVFPQAAWQRCTVHFARNIEGHIAKKDRDAARAMLRTIFQAPNRKEASEKLAAAVQVLSKAHERAARLLRDAEEEVLTFMSFPAEHWKQIRSTNPLERLNKEIGRRADVVGIFPSRRSVLRLIGAVLMEQDDEWRIGKRYMSLGSIAKLDSPQAAQLPEVA